MKTVSQVDRPANGAGRNGLFGAGLHAGSVRMGGNGF
jgi:hypothetical protein